MSKILLTISKFLFLFGLCLAVTACKNFEVPNEVIPLSLTPSTTKLTNGQTILISILSEEWKQANLRWRITSNGLSDLGGLSSNSEPTVLYKAPPSGEGEVTITITGTRDSVIGTASVLFSISRSPASLVALFPKIGIRLFAEPTEQSEIVGIVERYSRLPVKECLVTVAADQKIDCADASQATQIQPSDPFWVKVEIEDNISGWLDGRLVAYEGEAEMLPPIFRFYAISERADLPYVYGRVARDGGGQGNYLLRDYQLGADVKENQIAIVPLGTDVTILREANDWLWVLVVLPENSPPILRGALPAARVDESVEQLIRNYYQAINERDYQKAWSMLSKDFKLRNHGCSDDPNIICNDYLEWWNSIAHVDLDHVEIIEQRDSSAVIRIRVTYVQGTANVPGGSRLEIVKRDGKWLIN